jgi:hypothetical protein
MIFEPLRRLRSSRYVRRDRALTSAWEVIAWWEARRIPFNLILGGIGALSAAVILIIGLTYETISNQPVGLPDPPIFILVPVVVFGLMANVCYTGGWVVELLIRRAWPDESELAGTLSFTLGIVFAVIVTLLPIPLFGALTLLVLLLRL